MSLKLLLSLLCIVWRLSAAEEYTNHWISDDLEQVNFCSHDSYLNGSCVCNVDYNGKFCLKRKCRNFGFDATNFAGQGNDRCICPPGFIGRNCEPVRCMNGDQQVYSSYKNEKTISLLASYNKIIGVNWKDANIGELVCNYTEYYRNINYNNEGGSVQKISANTPSKTCVSNVNKFLDIDECTDEDGNQIDCRPLDITYLDSLVQNSPPNSIVFVATNMNVTSIDDDVTENIIATAIARKIQINVIVYNNTLPRLFENDPGLAYLNKIASATLGVFVLPSVSNNGTQLYGIVKTLLDMWDQDIGVSAVFTSDVPRLPIDTDSDFYIAAQTRGFDLTISSGSLSVVVNTDFWSLYKISGGVHVPTFSVSGQIEGTQVLAFTQDRLKTYSAFTSDINDYSVLDAAYSVSVIGASYPLVVRIESTDAVLKADSVLKAIGNNQPFDISTTASPRTQCQFSLWFDGTCTSVGASIITIVTNDRNSVSFPIYCASEIYAESIYNQLDREIVGISSFERRQSLADDVICPTTSNVESYGDRSFAIISDTSKNSFDNLYRDKNSVFYQLTDYSSGYNRYSHFLASFTDGSLVQHVDYGTFLTKVMTKTGTPTESSETMSVTNLLTQTIDNVNSFSDIFYIVNYNITSLTDEKKSTVKLHLAEKNARLFVAFVQPYATVDDDLFAFLNDLAVASGGVAVRLNDYSDVQKFFTKYYPLLVTNDIVAKSYSENQRAGVALGNVYMDTEEYVLLVTNENMIGDEVVTASISVDGIVVTALEQVGTLQLFSLSPSKPGIYNIPVRFDGLARMANVLLLSNSENQNFVGLTFLDENNNNNQVSYGKGKYTPFFYSSTPFTDGASVSITYSDPVNPAKPVYSGSIIDGGENCKNNKFSFTVDYGWICSISGGLYHFKVDTGNLTRTFPVTCIGNDASGNCLNGGTESDDNSCTCTIQWTGTKCQTPICQNGGIATTADTCNCPDGFTGDVCENSNSNCTSSSLSPLPDYRSDLSSLFIVADVNALATYGLSSGLDIYGVPITVVLYGNNNNGSIVLSTTNGQHLVDVLSPSSLSTALPTDSSTTDLPETANLMYEAINIALDNMLTDRALVVVLTSNSDTVFDNNLLIRLAAKRADLRVLSTSAALSNDYLTLSLVGNCVPVLISNSGDFDSYLRNYVSPLFSALQSQNNAPQRVFNVFQTGNIEKDTTISIPKDSTFKDVQSTVFVHVFNGSVTGETPTTKIGVAKIYKFDVAATEGKDVAIKQNGAGAYYSIETISYLKTVYGFTNDTNGADENLYVGARIGQANVLHIYSAPHSELSTTDIANFPLVSIREITRNGTVGNATIIPFTKKAASNCFFNQFVILDICSDNSTIGYQVQLTTRTSTLAPRQQQIVVTCHRSVYENQYISTSCGEKGSPSATCECNDGFTGIDCKEPICLNNGVRDVSVCRCPVKFHGRRCENGAGPVHPTTQSPNIQTSTQLPSDQPSTTQQLPDVTSTSSPISEIRAAAFILDIVGTSGYAFNESTRAIVEYVRAFNNSHQVMIVSNWNVNSPLKFDFQSYSSIDSLSTNLNLFWNVRNTSYVPSLTKAIDAIHTSYNKISSTLNANSLNIFYLTQVGLSTDDTPNLVGLEAFHKSSLVFSPFSKNADQSILDSLKPFSNGDITNVRDYYNGVKTMVASTANNETAVLPSKPNRSCAFGLQTNINVGIDKSKPSSNDIVENLNTFLDQFRQTFNYIDNDANRCTDASLPDFYNDRTSITSFIYYDGVVKNGNFCPSQYVMNMNSVINGTNESPANSQKTVNAIGNIINRKSCICNRYSDPDTFKYVVWLPRSAAPLSDTDGNDLKSLLKLSATNAYHFVVPFYEMADKDNDLYYQILVDQDSENADFYLLPNAATDNVSSIIEQLNQKLCETSGVDPTAIPPELERIDFSSMYNGIYEEDMN